VAPRFRMALRWLSDPGADAPLGMIFGFSDFCVSCFTLGYANGPFPRDTVVATQNLHTDFKRLNNPSYYSYLDMTIKKTLLTGYL
jgi:hypothetical protein